ncbi:unnamed protein product [Notodromas monacha]|uniref:Uncharacterized protein n=1 Tax=Notodromas monacha TaxID=399045 RepID=A0A7R9BIU1_9CRUS|nr:unnamed protein product [Notodromas monacha]CAG0915198.1 unnamed protein product [Notodromas monacha]
MYSLVVESLFGQNSPNAEIFNPASSSSSPPSQHVPHTRPHNQRRMLPVPRPEMDANKLQRRRAPPTLLSSHISANNSNSGGAAMTFPMMARRQNSGPIMVPMEAWEFKQARRSRSTEAQHYLGHLHGHGRRVSYEYDRGGRTGFDGDDEDFGVRDRSLPYFTPAEGDRLWVREQLLRSGIPLWDSDVRESRYDSWRRPAPLHIRSASFFDQQRQQLLQQRHLDTLRPWHSEEFRFLRSSRLRRFCRVMTTHSPPPPTAADDVLGWDAELLERDRGLYGSASVIDPGPRPSFVSRLENLDPSTDEFLVDAGVRMSPAAWKPLRQPPPPSILPLSALNNRLARSSALEALNAQQRPEGNLRRRQGFGMYFWDSEAAGSSPKSSSSSLRSSNAAKQMQLQDKQGGKKLPPTSVSDTNTKLTRMSTMPELAVQRRPPGIIAQKSVPTDVSRRKSAGTIGVAKPSKLRPPSSRMSFSGVASSPNTSSAESSPISSRSSSPGTTNDVVVTTPFARATAHRASLGAMRGLRQGVSPAGGGAAGIRARKQPSSANSSPTMSRASAAKLQDVGMGVQKRRSGGAVVATSSGSGYASSRLPQPRMLKEHTGGPRCLKRRGSRKKRLVQFRLLRFSGNRTRLLLLEKASNEVGRHITKPRQMMQNNRTGVFLPPTTSSWAQILTDCSRAPERYQRRTAIVSIGTLLPAAMTLSAFEYSPLLAVIQSSVCVAFLVYITGEKLRIAVFHRHHGEPIAWTVLPVAIALGSFFTLATPFNIAGVTFAMGLSAKLDSENGGYSRSYRALRLIGAAIACSALCSMILAYECFPNCWEKRRRVPLLLSEGSLDFRESHFKPFHTSTHFNDFGCFTETDHRDSNINITEFRRRREPTNMLRTGGLEIYVDPPLIRKYSEDEANPFKRFLQNGRTRVQEDEAMFDEWELRWKLLKESVEKELLVALPVTGMKTVPASMEPHFPPTYLIPRPHYHPAKSFGQLHNHDNLPFTYPPPKISYQTILASILAMALSAPQYGSYAPYGRYTGDYRGHYGGYQGSVVHRILHAFGIPHQDEYNYDYNRYDSRYGFDDPYYNRYRLNSLTGLRPGLI